MKALPLLFISAVIGAGCYYDTQQELYGVSTQSAICDTTKATYSYIDSSIIRPNCASCHTASTRINGGNIELDTYSTFVQQANTGKLMGDIEHLSGFNPMPQTGSKLSACDIATIQRWIDKGKQNN